MEPHTPAARLHWLAHTIERIAQDITALQAQFRALLLRSPALDGADQELVERLQRELETIERACALVRAQLIQLRTVLPGTSTEP